MQDIDLDEIRTKLYESLKPSGWADKLKTYLLSEEFKTVLTTLHNEVLEGHRFTPPLKYLFRAFYECPYNSVKVVVLGQDPYYEIDVADGIAFSCSRKPKSQMSLRYIYKEIRDTVDGYSDKTWLDHDLKHWSNQGMLLLNRALTVRINKPGTHFQIWDPFMIFLLDMLVTNNPGLTYVFLGKPAQEFVKYIPEGNTVFTASHPASAGHREERSWDSGNLFNKINNEMNRMYGEKIIW